MNPATHLVSQQQNACEKAATGPAPEAPGSAQLAAHVLGHYACHAQQCMIDAHGDSLPLLAALAAMETSARLGRRLPISVRARHMPTLQDDDFSQDHNGGVNAIAPAADRALHWSQWDEARLRHRPAREGLAVLASSQAGVQPPRPLLVELTGHQVEVAAQPAEAPVRILCRAGTETLLVTVLCEKNDPWAPASGAVAEMFAEILCELMNDPGCVPARVAAISAATRTWVLGPLSGRTHDHGEFAAIPHLIERSVDLQPDRIAYRFGSRSLSYRRFDGLANALAVLLCERGVVRGQTVGVVLANSLEMPVAYQALMKLGAAFVPLDPAWPVQRLQQALSMLVGQVVLCGDVATVPDESRGRALVVDIDALVPISLRPCVRLEPEDPIYGIFTSGTTGRPKCAMNNHGGLTNRFRFMSRYFHGGRGVEHVLQNSKHTFDSSVWQLFWPLTAGGDVVIPRQGAFLDLEAIIEVIAGHAIAMTDFVPSVFNQLVALAERHPDTRAKLGTLRELIVGGEEITPPMVHKLRALLPQLRVTNAYGPTETSIGMVFHPVDSADGVQIPLGRPIDNCHVVVVDEALRPLPPGGCGEILIGGACVGSGYLNDPDKTAQVFIDNPFPSIPGRLLYRSGDLGYFDSHGRLRFAGRRDFQVKVAGVRIELGEVEAAAQQYIHVHHAKALVSGAAQARFLALFVTGDPRLQEAALLSHLRGVLPRHSLPRHVLVLPAMPLTDGAKVDRGLLQLALDRHLAQPGMAGGIGCAGEAADPLQNQVLAIFRACLQLPALAIDQDFFEAGGDSLQAIETVLALEEACGVRLGVQELFGHPTVRRAAVRVRQLQLGGASHSAPIDDRHLMERDAALYADAPSPSAASRIGIARPSRIFVTGATGFVGGYLVRELLRAGVEVHALCRSKSDVQRNLTASMRARRLWEDRFSGRLHAVEGDLGKPGLGMGDDAWSRMAGGCDAILHCGALVNFLYDYRAHRPANVLGTFELLKLAREGRVPLHFVSTLGTLDRQAASQSGPLGEDFDPSQAIVPSSGYSRSKWVAERMLLSAREQHGTVTVFRLGEVMPCAAGGLANESALTHFLLSAFTQLGATPDAAIRSDWSPADYVAQRVIAAVLDPVFWNRTYHVFHPDSVCFARALDRAGARLERLSCRDWLQRLERRIAMPGPVPPELVLLRRFLPDAQAGEAALVQAFASLLTDNPRLFSRAGCRALEQARELPDDGLQGAIGAYRRSLDQRAARPAESLHGGTTA